MSGLFDLRPVRIAGALVVAAALCGVLATRVFTEFDALRVKLVKLPVPAADGSVRIETAIDARAARLAAPVAVIAVVRNPGAVEQTISITVDDRSVCATAVAGQSTRRLDCVVTDGWIRGPTHTIVITGSSPAWSLDFLEIATHHGSSSRFLPFHVLPNAPADLHRPSWLATGVTGLLLWAVLLVRPVETWPHRLVLSHRVVAVGVVALLAVIVVSPLASPFLLMMPTSSFVEVLALLLVPRWWRLVVLLVAQVRRLPWVTWLWRPDVGVAAVAVVAVLPFALLVQYSSHEYSGNYSGLLRISEEGFDRSPLLRDRADVRATLALLPNEGYDAQFMYFAAFDPLLRRFRDDPEQYRRVVDAAPYRFGRIGFPWMVRAVAGDRWSWYPAAMIGLVLLGVALSAGAVARLAQVSGRSALWGLAVLAIPGYWVSVRVVLPEPLAGALLLLGYLCVIQRRVFPAVALLALSLLIRETGVVVVVALTLLLPAHIATARDRLWIAAAVVPLTVWRLYVAAGLWSEWGWDALYYSSHNVSVPLLGVAQLWQVVAAGTYHPDVPTLATAAIWFPPVLVCVAAVPVTLWRHLDRPVGAAFLAYSLMALSLTFPNVWGHVGNAQRTSYEAFVLLALATATCPQSGWQRRLLILVWFASAAFILFGAHDALNTREAIFRW